MPHRSFGTVRIGAEREPITFDFGLYGEETFTVVPEPSLGDTFDLADAPEPTPTNVVEVARICARFISRMLEPTDRPRFSDALKRIPATQCHVVIETAEWITSQLTPFLDAPSPSSSGGRRVGGTSSKKRPATRRSR